jgi:DNA-binding NtrC family response regulator
MPKRTATVETTDLVPGSAPPHVVDQIRLRVTSGPDQGTVHASAGERISVGKHKSNDFILSDPAVSRFHFEIVVGQGKTRLRDVGSRNGTLVDGVSVLEANLHHGVRIALGRSELRFEVGSEQIAIPVSSESHFGRMVGRSPAMRAAFATLERAALGNATVLLTGETGTGKDVAAEMVHSHSPRAEGPFVVVDCGAMPGNLMESELFGHERGAFTGADRLRVGAFEAASGGTLFLDEIGELPVDLQPKLLRVLESRQVQRIGSTQRMPVDVRVVAATSRNLAAEVNGRRFRSDLYYRLAVIKVVMPPLRERFEDLPLLIDVLVQNVGIDAKTAELLKTNSFLSEIRRHAWPGNVRELRNYVERCLALDQALPLEEPVQIGSLAIDAKLPLSVARERWLRTFERLYARALLAEHQDNVTAAARAAGIDRTSMHRLLQRSGVRAKGDSD